MLKVHRIIAKYGPVEALHGISVDIKPNEIVAVIGPNGAGKSTLLRTVVGLTRLYGGTVWFDEDQIDGEPPEEILRRGLALVPEGRRIFANLTVLENLRIGAYIERNIDVIHDSLESVFNRFDILAVRRNQLAGTLSGGEQQQLAIARALMSHPKMLMIDEPSLGLAPVIIDVVMKFIKDLQHSGLTILLVEQNVHRAVEISERVYAMANGYIQFVRNSKDLGSVTIDLGRAYLGDDL